MRFGLTALLLLILACEDKDPSDGGIVNTADGAALDAGFPDADVDAGILDARIDAGILDTGPTDGPVRVRIMAANTTSGNYQSYDEGHGIRIFQGLQPDIVMIQEFNFEADQPEEFRELVDTTFGPEFEYFREATGSIPNGVISRWPILEEGEWEDPEVGNRGFAWARIDVPGPTDLWAISVHLLTRSSGYRNREAQALVEQILAKVPEPDFLVIGGDFNTENNNESCFQTLDEVIDRNHQPADQDGNVNTNAYRNKPYDQVLVDDDLDAHHTAVEIGANSFPHGLVFDSRVYSPLGDVSPARESDSDAPNMQHMAVVKDFLLPN